MATLRLVLLLLLAFVSAASAHNITHILAGQPQFSTFNRYLSETHLATEINRRLTITVLALDNSAMSALFAKGFSIYTIKNVLALHILTDYFGPKKLHQISRRSTLVSSLFQATGRAPGTTGFVNITNLRNGKVGFAPEDNTGTFSSFFVKSVADFPYRISVVQISSELASPEAESPAPPPPVFNLTELMTTKAGCAIFARQVAANADVLAAFDSCVQAAGLTIFCPVDSAMVKFMPKYRNLSAPAKTSLLFYHSIDMYSSMQQLKAGSGHQHTIASNGASTYNFTVMASAKGESIDIFTKIVTAKVLSTAFDQQPLAIYSIDKVLQPRELFKVPEADGPALAPGKKGSKKGGSSDDGSDDGSSDDSTADGKNDGTRTRGGGLTAAAAVAALVAGMGLF